MTPEHLVLTLIASVIAFTAGLLARRRRTTTPAPQDTPAKRIIPPDPNPLSPQQRALTFQDRYPPNWRELRRRVYRRDRHTCQNCSATQTRINAHHVVPVEAGGSHRLSNLTTLCDRCHALADGYASSDDEPSSDDAGDG